METGHQQGDVAAEDNFNLIRDDLRCVEKAIGIESATSSDTVKPISKYLEQSEAPYLRAALLLVCARVAGGGGRMAIQFGAIVEMMHTAAHIHGQMIGMERPRLGKSWVKRKSANCPPVLAGDWLYLGAFRVALQERVLHLVIGVAQRMVTADLIQLDRLGDISVTEADCIDLADRKTACLFSTCGTLGAVAAGADSQDGEDLAEFAWNLGMAFQLIDDMLDFVGHDSALDKHTGNDLKNRKVTLPLVYALADATKSEQDLVAQVLLDRSYDAVPFANVMSIVDRYSGIQRTRARAEQYLECARQIATSLDGHCREALFTLIDVVREHDDSALRLHGPTADGLSRTLGRNDCGGSAANLFADGIFQDSTIK